MQRVPDPAADRPGRHIAWIGTLTWAALTLCLLLAAFVDSHFARDQLLQDLAQASLTQLREGGTVKPIVYRSAPFKSSLYPHEPHTFAYQIWNREGVPVFRSSGAPPGPLTSGEAGFGYASLEGADLRTLTLWNPDGSRQVQAGVSSATTPGDFAWPVVAPSIALLIAISTLCIYADRAEQRSRRIWARAAEVFHARTTGNLTRIQPPSQPRELIVIVGAFNRLLSTLEESMQRESRFAYEAAHAVRSPLQSLATLIGGARSASDRAARLAAFQRADELVGRTVRVIERLLQFRDIEKTPRDSHERLVDIDVMVRGAVDDVGPAAGERGIAIQGAPMVGNGQVRGNPAMLGLALRVLIENAVALAPANGIVYVEGRRDAAADAVILRVHDNGPGISKDPGFEDRAVSAPVQSSTAELGLAIVERIVKHHDGSAHMGVSSLLGGVMAEIRLPCQRP